MLLRHQVLLSDWQTAHLKKMAQHNDLSFSEIIRLLVCEGIIRASSLSFPECKIDKKKLDNLTIEGTSVKTDIARRHKIISDVYFEARKIADYVDSMIEKDKANAK
jgi:hypothetical protein